MRGLVRINLPNFHPRPTAAVAESGMRPGPLDRVLCGASYSLHMSLYEIPDHLSKPLRSFVDTMRQFTKKLLVSSEPAFPPISGLCPRSLLRSLVFGVFGVRMGKRVRFHFAKRLSISREQRTPQLKPGILRSDCRGAMSLITVSTLYALCSDKLAPQP